MDRIGYPDACIVNGGQIGQEPLWLDDEEADESEAHEAEAGAGAAAYGSLLGLGKSMRRKQPCIVVDPEEAENAARLVQHFAARRFAGEDVDESELWSTPDDEETEPVAILAPAEPAPAFDIADEADVPLAPLWIEPEPEIEARESAEPAALPPPPAPAVRRHRLRRRLPKPRAARTLAFRLAHLRRWLRRLLALR